MLVSLVLLIVLIVVIVYYSRKVSQLSKKVVEVQFRSQQQAQQIAKQMFDSWVNQLSQQLRQQLEQSIKQQYEAQLEVWKQQSEEIIRRDAIARSVNTLLGRMGGGIRTPLLLADKYQVSPKDFRHF